MLYNFVKKRKGSQKSNLGVMLAHRLGYYTIRLKYLHFYVNEKYNNIKYIKFCGTWNEYTDEPHFRSKKKIENEY